MSNHANLIYALKDGMITSIKDVQSGLKCGCVCPACGAQLVARKGMKKMHHFAHYSGENCEYGYETSLHLAAKDILSKAKKMTIPAVYVHFPNSPKGDELVSSEMEVNIDRVELEKRINDIIPDVVVYTGGKCFLVEIFVTHSIGTEKLKKIEKENISTIEIDLSKEEKDISSDDISKILLESSEKKAWKYNSLEKKTYQRLFDVAEELGLVESPFITHELDGVHVDGCPLECRKWRGRTYASLKLDCNCCEYFISYTPINSVKCAGKARIADLKGFRETEEQRICESNARVMEKRRKVFESGRCPNCYGRLILKRGSQGNSWSCGNSPDCIFSSSEIINTAELQMSI